MKRPTSLRHRFLVSFGALLAGLGGLSLAATLISAAVSYRNNLALKLRQAAGRLENHLRHAEESLFFRTRILSEVARVEASGADPQPLRQLQVYTLRWLTHDGLEILGMGSRRYWKERGKWGPLMEKAFSGVPSVALQSDPHRGAALVAASPRESDIGVEEVIAVALPLGTSLLQEWAALLGAEVALLARDGTLLGSSLPAAVSLPVQGAEQGTVRTGGTSYAYYRFPLRVGSRPAGWGMILLPTGDLRALAVRNAMIQGGVLVLGMMGFFFLYRVVVRRATSDLERLTGWARDFDPATPSPPPAVASGDEVDVLAASFGDLLDRLEAALAQVAAANEELSRTNQTLEDRVREKTRELEAERQRLDTVLSGMPHAVFLVDANGRVVYANQEARRRFGPVEGLRCQRVLGTNGPLPEETETEARIGDRIYLLQRSPAGEGRAVLVAQDVTERRALERQLQHAQRMESVGRLAAGVAHDFNNILGSMIPSLEMLKHRTQDPKALRYLKTVMNGADRAADLVRQLLMFSRAGEFQPQEIDLNQAVERALHLVEPSLGKVELRWRPHPDLERVRADPTQVQQVVFNLALNALDAMEDGGILTVETFPDPDTGQMTLAVEDTGPGIPEDQAERVFDPFFTTKDPGKGTGLGLAIVYGVAERHGGTVRLITPPAGGARFEVTFPPASSDRPDETPSAARA
ncbi:MAG: PAS domain-containing protein [Deltaproteobacteria bacterium]|nr:PAS domain-containing protein [Deltaproteobacteria bacterium]